MDVHDECDRIFGPCWVPGCPGANPAQGASEPNPPEPAGEAQVIPFPRSHIQPGVPVEVEAQRMIETTVTSVAGWVRPPKEHRWG